jgi:DNA polymerase
MARELLEHLRFLHELGVEAVRLPAPVTAVAPATSATASAATTSATASAATTSATDGLAGVRAELGDCTRCRLSAGRTQIVFGVGNPHADLVFVGEAPGQEEDRQGEPFVGRAGQLLDKMIGSIGLSREAVYIANIVKCRPPDNRNPQADEIAACSPFLIGQIEAIRPRVIVALGKFAASTLLGEEVAITRARGRLRAWRGIPLMPTFHPAYLLRQYTRENRQPVFEDLLAVQKLLGQPGPA